MIAFLSVSFYCKLCLLQLPVSKSLAFYLKAERFYSSTFMHIYDYSSMTRRYKDKLKENIPEVKLLYVSSVNAFCVLFVYACVAFLNNLALNSYLFFFMRSKNSRKVNLVQFSSSA